MNPDQIKNLASLNTDEIISIRRTIHANPELSFKENETASFVESILDKWGINHERIADTGITGVIDGAGSGKYLVLRADLDALPITEGNLCEYRSKNEGVMHACGHDVHTAALLGAIKILTALKNEWNGRIRFIFQPGEEMLPGGALKILETGLLDNPEPDFIIAEHVYPDLPAGSFGFREGPYMASTDEIYFEVKGVGGHGALPHRVIDPVLISSHLIVALQQIVSRRIPADIPSVLSFGKVDAPGSTNVIPSIVKIEGTFRIMNEQWRAIALDEIRRTAEGLVTSMGGTLECRIVPGYPELTNDAALTSRLKHLAVVYAGSENIEELPRRMTGEDFARYAQRFPAVFYRLGTGGSGTGGERYNNPVHHPEFDVDESSLTHGMGMMAWLAAGLLK
jgi:amidohydrolase